MAARIQIEVREIRGPWLDIVIERREENNVVRVVFSHKGPGGVVSAHTTEPEVFTGMWEFAAYAEETAGDIKFIGIELEVLAENLKGVHRTKRGRRFKLMIQHPSRGFFEVEGIAIMSDGDIAGTKDFMKVFYQSPVIFQILLIPWVIREGFDGDSVLVRPSVGKRKHIPVL